MGQLALGLSFLPETSNHEYGGAKLFLGACSYISLHSLARLGICAEQQPWTGIPGVLSCWFEVYWQNWVFLWETGTKAACNRPGWSQG